MHMLEQLDRYKLEAKKLKIDLQEYLQSIKDKKMKTINIPLSAARRNDRAKVKYRK